MSTLDPGIQAFYRAASTDRLIIMRQAGVNALGTDKATEGTPTAIAFIEQILRDRNVDRSEWSK